MLNEIEKTDSLTIDRDSNFFPVLSNENLLAMKYAVFKLIIYEERIKVVI